MFPSKVPTPLHIMSRYSKPLSLVSNLQCRSQNLDYGEAEFDLRYSCDRLLTSHLVVLEPRSPCLLPGHNEVTGCGDDTIDSAPPVEAQLHGMTCQPHRSIVDQVGVSDMR